jgi:hypothetical protein
VIACAPRTCTTERGRGARAYAGRSGARVRRAPGLSAGQVALVPTNAVIGRGQRTLPADLGRSAVPNPAKKFLKLALDYAQSRVRGKNVTRCPAPILSWRLTTELSGLPE